MFHIDHHWLEAFHIIAVFAWMIGLVYLPRLYVYHASAVKGSELDKTLQVMEVKLLRTIMNPAMIVALLLGITLAITTGYYKSLWLHIKFLLVIVLLGIHGLLAFYRKSFVKGLNKKSPFFFVVLNESIFLVFMLIVILAVVKPFN